MSNETNTPAIGERGYVYCGGLTIGKWGNVVHVTKTGRVNLEMDNLRRRQFYRIKSGWLEVGEHNVRLFIGNDAEKFERNLVRGREEGLFKQLNLYPDVKDAAHLERIVDALAALKVALKGDAQ